MSRLYIRVMTGFYSHRKTARLRSMIGDDAFWLPPRLWAYAAENQPDGDISSYNATELAMLLGYNKDATSMLEALTSCGFVDSDMKIHGWMEHNGYHEKFARRAKTAAQARWAKEKPPTPPKEVLKEEKEIGKGKGETSIASSMLVASDCGFSEKKSGFGVEKAKAVLSSAFKRPAGSVWNYAEESALVECARRPGFHSELFELLAFRDQPKSFFPKSISRLLADWDSTLDRARNHKDESAPPRQPTIQEKEMAKLQQEIDRL